MPTSRSAKGSVCASRPSKSTRPPSANSSPARMRRSVVLPEPEGPRSPRNSPSAISRFTRSRTSVFSKLLTSPSTVMRMPASVYARRAPRAAEAPFEHRFDSERDKSHQRKQRGDREGGGKGVIVVKHLDVQRHGVGEPDDVARHDRDGAELADSAPVAEEHAVEQAPLDVGQRHAPEGLEAVRAEDQGGLLLGRALGFHEGDELACDEGQRDEERRERDAWHREDDLHAVRRKPGAKQALQTEEQHVDEPRDDRRDGKGQVDERQQRALAPELELSDRPGGCEAKERVERHADRCGKYRELDRGARLGLRESGEIDARTFAKGLGKHEDQREHEEESEERKRKPNQHRPNVGRL